MQIFFEREPVQLRPKSEKETHLNNLQLFIVVHTSFTLQI